MEISMLSLLSLLPIVCAVDGSVLDALVALTCDCWLCVGVFCSVEGGRKVSNAARSVRTLSRPVTPASLPALLAITLSFSASADGMLNCG